MNKRYTKGIAFDGAAILDNGKPITITEIINRLNRLDSIEGDRPKSNYFESKYVLSDKQPTPDNTTLPHPLPPAPH